MYVVIVALIAGLFVGSLSGLVGIGGGVVLIPVLLYAFKVDMHTAAGTSLAIIVPTAVMGALAHFNRGSIDLRLAMLVAVGAVGGSFLGTWVGDMLPENTLKKIFAVILLLIAINVLLDAYKIPIPWKTD